MTGDQLKIEIKKLGLAQTEAANKIGVSRQTLSVWMRSAIIDKGTAELVKTKLNIKSDPNSPTIQGSQDKKDEQIDRLLHIIESQQRTIEELTKKNAEGAGNVARMAANE